MRLTGFEHCLLLRNSRHCCCADGMGGGNRLFGNLFFNQVRESSDAARGASPRGEHVTRTSRERDVRSSLAAKAEARRIARLQQQQQKVTGLEGAPGLVGRREAGGETTAIKYAETPCAVITRVVKHVLYARCTCRRWASR